MTSFAKDLLISYAHIDNQPLTPDEKGWISRFHASLEALLSMRLGKSARIWRDDKLRGNDIFSDEITDQFSDVAVLVSILTPRYLNSKWCTREVREFCAQAEQRGGIVVDNKSRLFKVLKTPVDTQEALPAAMKDALGYEFYTYDEDHTPLELDPAYGEKYGQDYNRKVGKLAWEIKQLLHLLEADAVDGRGDVVDDEQATAKAAVYLAECSYDCKQPREKPEGELKRHGYQVLPDQQMPRDEHEYVAAVERLLERARLSIHIIGNTYGGVPDGPTQRSETLLQNELAAKRSKSGALARVIWLPHGTTSEQPTHQAFIELLHHDAEAQFGADLITGDFETLKTAVHATLKKLEEPKLAATQTDSTERHTLIYLICDERDRKATVPIRKFCKEQGFDVELPIFEGDATALREANEELLRTCDAVILFYGVGDEAWKRTLDNEIKKVAGQRKGEPPLPRYTYLAEPTSAGKEDLIDMEESGVIDGLSGFHEAAMTAFLEAMTADEEAR